MKHLLSTTICLLFVISSHAQTSAKDLLGKWETATLREVNIVDGKKTTEDHSFEGERTYNFSSNKLCYITTAYSDVAHPHEYVIKENMVYFTMLPAHLKKLMEGDEIYGIELEPTEFEFAVDTAKKRLYLTRTSVDENKNTQQSIFIFKKKKK